LYYNFNNAFKSEIEEGIGMGVDHYMVWDFPLIEHINEVE